MFRVESEHHLQLKGDTAGHSRLAAQPSIHQRRQRRRIGPPSHDVESGGKAYATGSPLEALKRRHRFDDVKRARVGCGRLCEEVVKPQELRGPRHEALRLGHAPVLRRPGLSEAADA